MGSDLRRPRNDPGQYDDLVDEWWRPAGAFSPLHWLARARGRLIPPPRRQDAVLLDVGCGGGLMAPHVHGYRHVGVDLIASALHEARRHGVVPVQGDVTAIPVADASADVVLAGEIFEHVEDLEGTVAEVARVLRPGGVLVCDTLNATWLCRLLLVTLAERVRGIVPRGLHDPALFVRPDRLRALCDAHGIDLAVWGLRPAVPDFLRWLVRRARPVRMRPTRSTALVYQGLGLKR